MKIIKQGQTNKIASNKTCYFLSLEKEFNKQENIKIPSTDIALNIKVI